MTDNLVLAKDKGKGFLNLFLNDMKDIGNKIVKKAVENYKFCQQDK